MEAPWRNASWSPLTWVLRCGAALRHVLPGRTSPTGPGASRAEWRLWALRAGLLLGNVLPRRAAYAAARLAADLAYRFRDQARADVQDNMRHVMGPDAPPAAVDAAAREVFRNVARYYIDLVRLTRGDYQRIFDREFKVTGLEKLTGRLDARQPVVTSTAHFGNPELIFIVLTITQRLNALVLVEPLQPPEFARAMYRIRSSFGLRFYDAGYRGISAALKLLREGGCASIVSDRDLQQGGAVVEFFGAEARLPVGAVDLAARTGAVLLPVFSRRTETGWEVVFEDPLELTGNGRDKLDTLTNVRRLAERFEEWIRADPGQWMVLERIWKPLEEPEPRLEAAERA